MSTNRGDFTGFTSVIMEKELALTAQAVSRTTVAITALTVNSSYIRLASGAGNMTIQGIAAGLAGQRLLIQNPGSANLAIDLSSTAASAANRIITGGTGTLTVSGAGAVELMYDGTASRWFVISSTA